MKSLDEQIELSSKLIEVDAFSWSLSASHGRELRLVAGVDISFVKGSDVDAVASLVVLSFPGMELVYQDFRYAPMRYPYIPGFLAFREVEHLVPLFESLRASKPGSACRMKKKKDLHLG